jgi:hypothetical protein
MGTPIEMPLVTECAVRECAYNSGQHCHARAITIGDGLHPACDTFVLSREHCDDGVKAAGVGACKVSTCVHNRHLECEAPSIRVGYHDDHPDCMAFAER